MSVLPPEIIFRILREANCDSPKSISKELSSHTEIFLSYYYDYPISKREINEVVPLMDSIVVLEIYFDTFNLDDIYYVMKYSKEIMSNMLVPVDCIMISYDEYYKSMILCRSMCVDNELYNYYDNHFKDRDVSSYTLDVIRRVYERRGITSKDIIRSLLIKHIELYKTTYDYVVLHCWCYGLLLSSRLVFEKSVVIPNDKDGRNAIPKITDKLENQTERMLELIIDAL